MAELATPQVIEFFHLAFLQVLQARFDPAHYVLKGGANLRYFFNSDRYSEDIDLDIKDGAGWRLAEKVDEVLASPALETILRGSELVIDEANQHKQTDTTRRWKLGLSVAGHAQSIRTKIEFSNRNGDGRYLLEAIPSRIVDPYALRAPRVQHYLGEAAAEQKVLALVYRQETQARDVFDLGLLLRSYPVTADSLDQAELEKAADLATELSYEVFSDQVLPFLDPAVADLYDSDTWDQICLEVAEKLGAVK